MIFDSPFHHNPFKVFLYIKKKKKKKKKQGMKEGTHIINVININKI